jgi:hypothetical protein
MRPTICRMRPLRKRMRPSDMRIRPSANVCAPQPAVYAWSNPDHPTWQRCGSHRGQGKSRFILSKVNKTLTLIGRTRTLSDVTDGRTDRCTDNPGFSWAGGPWRTASGGRPLEDGPWWTAQAEGSAMPSAQPSAFQPTVGAGDQWSDGRSPKPTTRWNCGRHAVRRTSVGLSDASGRPADADVWMRDNPSCYAYSNLSNFIILSFS